MQDANNFYLMSTATSISNSGTGTNALSKPAGNEVASVAPGKKWSVYIPTQASFTTDFNSDVGSFNISMYAKPEPGVVMTVAGHSVSYTGYSFTLTNEIGELVEIPVSSDRSHLIVLSYSNMEVGLFVDGEGGSIGANTLSTFTPLAVTLLHAGGILDHVRASVGSLSRADITTLLEAYNSLPELPAGTLRLTDAERQFSVRNDLSQSMDLFPGDTATIPLPSTDCLAFKVEYLFSGSGFVTVNGYAAYSGITLTETPADITVVSVNGCKLQNVSITEYYSDVHGIAGPARVTTTTSSGNPAPIHQHDDNAGTRGDTTVVLDETANTLAGWFYASNGSPMPGVTMNNNVLTGTGLYVNGKTYTAGAVVRDWYFLTKTGAATGTFTSTVPTQSITASTDTLTAAQIDDLYESFFGNPTLTAATETIVITEHPAFVISTEWSIVTSG